MKKKFSLLLSLALTLSLTACGGQTDLPGNTPPEADAPGAPSAGPAAGPGPSENAGMPDTIPAPTGDGGILIAYFGVPETDGTDTVANASRVATEDGVVGNCQFIAQAIQQAVGGDLFAIETERELALAGVEALADFIQECGLPTRLGELSARMSSVQLITSGTLKEIADSCNLIQTGQAQLSHMEIYEI